MYSRTMAGHVGFMATRRQTVFEKLDFHLSTLHHLAGISKFLHSGDRFRKSPFSVMENTVLIGQTKIWVF